MQSVAYSQSEDNHDQEAAKTFLVEDGEGQAKAEMPVDADAYVQGHERALLVWHPDSGEMRLLAGAHPVGILTGILQLHCG